MSAATCSLRRFHEYRSSSHFSSVAFASSVSGSPAFLKLLHFRAGCLQFLHISAAHKRHQDTESQQHTRADDQCARRAIPKRIDQHADQRIVKKDVAEPDQVAMIAPMTSSQKLRRYQLPPYVAPRASALVAIMTSPGAEQDRKDGHEFLVKEDVSKEPGADVVPLGSTIARADSGKPQTTSQSRKYSSRRMPRTATPRNVSIDVILSVAGYRSGHFWDCSIRHCL